jgi:hypothetical protein
MPKPPQWFDIPAGTRATECRQCSDAIWFIETATGEKMPVDMNESGSFEPINTYAGKGASHFASCTFADTFRSPR